MIKKLLEAISGREYELRERIFRMLILVGGSLAIMGILECLILMDVKTVIIPLILLLAVFCVELVITFKYHKIDIAAVIVALLIILIVFPTMFFLSGGLEGGAVIWFVLGLLYVFLMFSGKRLIFFLCLSLVTDIFTYAYGYYHQEAIIPMDSPAAAYMDSLFAMLAVGLAGGIILKAQMKMFNVERDLARRQQKELEQISESKNSFFASMSHEIRTPINTIVGLNEMIIRETKEKGTREYARSIQSASKMLLNLVNDILDLSQIEMKKMEIIPLEYKTEDVFSDLIDMIQVRLMEKKLDFQVDIDETIPSVLWGDVKRIKQVILNILTNAAKYTSEGSVVFSVHVESMDADEVCLKITVEDTGIGIRKEDLQHLYDSFKRVDTHKNLRIEGSGLGLSITKQLVDLMGGEISVDSIYTKGSTFTVMLPQKIMDRTPIGAVKFLSRSRAHGEEYKQSFEAPEARILIVDDNSMNLLVERKLLEATKMRIDTAGSGDECLEKTLRKYYHVILLDYMMPGMDGLETLRQLRRQENSLCRDSAVIVLSAKTAGETEKNFFEENFDGYLEKPIQGADLEAEILKFFPEDIIEYRREKDYLEDETKLQKISHHKKRKIYITTDCVSEVPDSLLEKYDIGLMYLYIKTDSGRFADTWEISSDNLSQFMTATTSNAIADSVSVEEYEDFFAEALTHSEQVVHISMAKNIGKSYEVAKVAAQSFDHVQVIESSQISCGQGLIVLYGGLLAAQGHTAGEICEKVENIRKRIESRFMMPSAKIFYEHGYTSKVFAKVCDVFSFHPVMKMKQSKLTIVGLGSGRMDGAWRRFIRRHLRHNRKINDDVIFISHVACSVEQQKLIQREVLRCIPFKRVIIQRASVTTACSSGIGTFGFAYFVNAGADDLDDNK